MFNIICDQRDANENHHMVTRMANITKEARLRVGKDVEKTELPHIAKWYNHFGKLFGSFL